MSSRLYEAAVENSVFMDHVSPVEDFGSKKGETVTITRVRNVSEPVSAVLDEQTRIPEDTFNLSTRSITVQELGRALPYTSLSLDLSEFDLENPIQKKLREQMRLVLDSLAAAAYKRALIKVDLTATTTITFATAGVFTNTSTRNWLVSDVAAIRDYMFDDLTVPPLEGGDYMAIVRTLGLRGIKNDPKWEEWHKYTDPQAKFNGEVGRLESVRFVETNHVNALGKVGTASVLGEGIVFGDDGVALAEALTPELRAAIPGDFGRSRAVAWYGILRMEPVWDTGNRGEAKILHIGSL
jgi:N4-gp56 family major capsid protein